VFVSETVRMSGKNTYESHPEACALNVQLVPSTRGRVKSAAISSRF
jgi:hypothetical protein